MAHGGDILEITFNHPTLGNGQFFPKSGEDSTFQPGGFESDDDEQGVTGSGEMIDKMNNTRWGAEAVCAYDMNGRDDVSVAKRLAESAVLADWTITHINGCVYGGKGKPVGRIEGNMNAATFTLKVAGSGKAKKIVG